VRRAVNLTGQRFGRLTVCVQAPRPKTDRKGYAWWECVCECGERVIVRSTHLRQREVRSCGCLKRADLWGQRFGRLVVEDLGAEKDDRGGRPWICRCDCGAVVRRSGWQLTSRDTTSCGCALRDARAAFGQRSNGATHKSKALCTSP
jgi:hypothetical protein